MSNTGEFISAGCDVVIDAEVDRETCRFGDM
jgi:hypothetical protein